jgi:short-subunit dehydrogenase
MKRIATGSLVLAACAAAVYTCSQRNVRIRLHDRVVIITGGSRGYGLQLARECARRGARLGLIARNQNELEAAENEFRAAGVRISVAACDVGDEQAVGTAVTALENELGPTDVLINAAGTIRVGPFEAQSTQRFRDEMQTNFFGALHTIMSVLPGMKSRKRGTIVNVSSIGGSVPVPHLLPYVASKFALNGFSQGLRAELDRSGVIVCTVLPGLMRTGSPPHALFSSNSSAEYAWFSAGVATQLSSVSVEYAAKVTIDGVQQGQRIIVISLQANMLHTMQSRFPSVTAALLRLAARFMPYPQGNEERTGAESESAFTASAALALSHKAEETQNQRTS